LSSFVACCAFTVAACLLHQATVFVVVVGDEEIDDQTPSSTTSSSLDDGVEDSLYDPIQVDPDCRQEGDGGGDAASCWSPPETTIEQHREEMVQHGPNFDATCSYGGNDPDEGIDDDDEKDATCAIPNPLTSKTRIVDKHWGRDPTILRMRDKLRLSGTGASMKHERRDPKYSAGENSRPPIFLLPGLASTRLVAWRFKACNSHLLLSDIKVQDYVWLNINLIMQMGTIDVSCMKECLQLGWNQSDTDNLETVRTVSSCVSSSNSSSSLSR